VLGAVIVSLQSERMPIFVGVPPILTGFAVLGVGLVKDGRYEVRTEQRRLPPAGSEIFGQGLMAGSDGILASDVVAFTIQG
jgi:hypothetical protein